MFYGVLVFLSDLGGPAVPGEVADKNDDLRLPGDVSTLNRNLMSGLVVGRDRHHGDGQLPVRVRLPYWRGTL